MRNTGKTVCAVIAGAMMLFFAGCGNTAAGSGGIQDKVPAANGSEAETVPGADFTYNVREAYYNDYLRLTLILKTDDSYTLQGPGQQENGTYILSGGTLSLSSESGELSGIIDGDGDLLIQGMTGYFLSNWAFWGIDDAEVFSGAAASSHLESLDLGGGVTRYRDFSRSIAFSCTGGAEPTEIPGLRYPVITDGSGSYVAGRNVTGELDGSGLESDAYLESYMRTEVISCMEKLFGGEAELCDVLVSAGGSENQLAHGQMSVKLGDRSLSAQAVLYRSVFSDGTSNTICKSFMGDAESFDSLSKAVSGMCALKMDMNLAE